MAPQTPPQVNAPVNLPNARTILLLGIASILLSWWHFISLAGLILSIISLVMAKKEMQLYYSRPDAYTLQSLNNIKAGRTFALIGLAISAIIFLFVILLILGLLAALPFWGMLN
mgnify:FL=1